MIRPAPLFPEPLHVGRPNLGDRQRLLARIEDVLDRRWLTNDGPCVKELESELAAWLGVDHCVAVSNATVGLELTIRALGLTGEVIVPSFTFPATVHALAWSGVEPVFCDVDPHTHNLCPNAVELLIGPRTSGILGVHLWGNPCDVEALAELADRRNLALLFDAAHALGCAHRGRMIGNFGSAEVFSLHATKFVNSGEGGVIATNDAELAARLRRMRNFGMQDAQVAETGTNAKMSELTAALGLTSLEHRDEFIARNRENYLAYERTLADVPGMALCGQPAAQQHNYQYVVVAVDATVVGLSRDEVVAALHAENVLAKRYFFPGCHRMAPYRWLPSARAPLPHTEQLCDRLLQLPTGAALTPHDAQRIADFLRRLTGGLRRAA